jgi:hypothetical protein
MKSGSLNLLEPCRPHRASYGTAISTSLKFVFIYIVIITANFVQNSVKGKAVPFTGLEWPRGFQEVKVPRFHANGTGWW